MTGLLQDLALVAFVLSVAIRLPWAVGALVLGRRPLALRLAGELGVVVALYAAALLAFSLASREHVLPPGVEKSVAGFDPHLHYRVADPVRVVPEGGVEVTVRLRSDARRAVQDAGTLTAWLVDRAGRRWPPATSSAGARDANGWLRPFALRLAPGDSSAVTLQFLPEGPVDGMRLLVEEGGFPCTLTLGHEASPLHRKTYFALEPAGS